MLNLSVSFLVSISLLFAIGVNAQNQHAVLGEYYTVPGSTIKAPFADLPYHPTETANEIFSISSLAYAFPEIDDDSNLLYCVEVVTFLTNDIKTGKEKVSFYAEQHTLNMQFSFGGKLIQTTSFNDGESFEIITKNSVFADFGEGIMTSHFQQKNGKVIHSYVITQLENQNNNKIQLFFDAVKTE